MRSRRTRAVGLSIYWLAVAFSAAVLRADTEIAPEPKKCALRWVDDRDIPIEERLRFCRPGAGCLQVASGELELFPGETVEVEGPVHGPFVGKAARDEGEADVCTIRVPRKIRVLVQPLEKKRERLTVSFYRVEIGSELGRPVEQLTVTSEEDGRLYLPAEDYLVALTLKGWAPDLSWIGAEPGSEHKFRFQPRDGWSLALRTVRLGADDSSEPVDGVRIRAVETEGFENEQQARLAPLREGKTRDRGVFILSGIAGPIVTVSTHHPDFIDTGLPAVSSTPATFHFFELPLDPGASLDVEVIGAEGPTAGVVCELQKPKQQRGGPAPETEWSGVTDRQGRCVAETLRPGIYSLRISRDGHKTDARREIELLSGETATSLVRLQEIHITGTARAGEEPVSGERVEISPLHLRARVAPEVIDFDETDEEGRYELTVGASGTYSLYLVNADQRQLELEDDTEVDFELSSFQIVGRVVDRHGEPLPEAGVTSVLERGSRKRFLRVEKDGAGGFRCRFPKGGGFVEITARMVGFEQSEPVRLRIEEGVEPRPVEVVMHGGPEFRGRVTTFSGAPAADAWVAIYGISSGAAPPRLLDTTASDSDGRFALAAVEKGTARVFFGGRGCALTTHLVELNDPEAELALSCGIPANLQVRLLADKESRSAAQYQPLLLRTGDTVIPKGLLRRHLSSLGLPHRTDSDGRLSLMLLESGPYDLFHGRDSSEWNLQSGHEAGYLSTVQLDPWATVELKIPLDLDEPEPFQLDLER